LLLRDCTTVRIVSLLLITVALEGLYLDQIQKVNTSEISIIILQTNKIPDLTLNLFRNILIYLHYFYEIKEELQSAVFTGHT